MTHRPLPLCTWQNSHFQFFSTRQQQQPLSSSLVWDFMVTFHNTYFNLGLPLPFYIPSAPPAYEILPISATSNKGCSQSSRSDVSYNLLWTIWPLKRKIAFNISSLWKTTTIKRYNCNAAASVSTWLGQLLSMTGRWGAYKVSFVISASAQDSPGKWIPLWT